MSYYIHKFGPTYAEATALPLGAGVQDTGVDPVKAANIVLPGGGTFNTQGSDQALPSGKILTVRGTYKATTAAALQTLVDAMRAYIGKYDKLWIYCGDTTQRWRYARFLDVSMESDPHQFGRFWQPMELTFELDDMLWYGDTINSDTITLDAGSGVAKSGEINNGGNQVVRDITITLTAQTTPITQCDIENEETGHVTNMRFSGSLAATKSLVIDCGEMTVKNDGTDAWDDWDRQAAHTINDWLRLKDGNNTIKVTQTGGGATSACHFGFYDGWA